MKRISVDQTDIGFRIWNTIMQAGCAVNVTLDGVPQPHVLVADEDEGYIVRQGADPIGDIRSGKWPVETVRGLVRIEIVTPVATAQSNAAGESTPQTRRAARRAAGKKRGK